MRNQILTLLALGAVATNAVNAEEISDTFVCVTQDLNVCKVHEGCAEMNPIEMNAPDFWKVELKKKRITVRTNDGAYDTTEFATQQRLGDMILVQGIEAEPDKFDEPLAWSMSVHAFTGRMSVSVSAHEEVVSILGTCHAL